MPNHRDTASMPASAKVVIVGSGPAGVAVAAALVQKCPELHDEILVLEKARHPRHKLCGGGITPRAQEMLARLNLDVRVPHFRIDRVAFYLAAQPLIFEGEGLMRTIRRNEFDAALVQRLREMGIRVIEQTAVRNIQVGDQGLRIETERGNLQCELLVGADGANSTVRRRLFRENSTAVSRLVEVLVPVSSTDTIEFSQKRANFDFRAIRSGLQGYMWDFPSWIDGHAYLNIGVFDSRIHRGTRADLRRLLRERLQQRGIATDSIKFMGHPERWYHPAFSYSRPRVLLVGDAAGIEPWLGEGISVALNYGPVAAESLYRALSTGDYSFASYGQDINRSPLGAFLNRNRILARYFYRRRLAWLLPVFGKILTWHLERKKIVKKTIYPLEEIVIET